MSELRVETCLSEHRDGVVSIFEAVRAAGGALLSPYVSEGPAAIAEHVERSQAGVRLVALIDGVVVGYAEIIAPDATDPDLSSALAVSGAYNPAGIVQIANLCVHPDCYRADVAVALLRAAARTGWELGYRPAMRAAVTHGDAVELCRREGWVTAGSFVDDSSGVENLIFLAPDDASGLTGFVRAGVRDGGVGSVATGIEVSTTFTMEHPGEYGEFAYARSQNPTRKALEDALATVEAAKHAMAFSSGLAAIDTVLRLLSPGDRVLLGTDAYGGTWRLLDKMWARYSIGVDVVDMGDPAAVAAAWGPHTKMVMVETPSNPTLQIADIRALADVAHRSGGWLVVDNTFATPWLQRPLSLGADVVVHSATKYLGGHSDVIAGALMTDNDDLAAEFRFAQRAVGAVPGPFDSFLVLRGLRTLPLRVERQSANAAEIAAMLQTHPAVERVYYPGLPNHPGYDIAARQMRSGGGMVSFTVVGGVEAAIETVKRTRVFTLAESLGAVESLIEHPASMTHAANSGSLLEVDPALIRVSVGIEDVWVLLADLRQALPNAVTT